MKILQAPINPRSLVEATAQRLVTAIRIGELSPGVRLRELTLAKDLGVSRGVLREALRQLEGRRLVERTVNIGVRIAVLSDKEIVDIFLIWGALATLAANLAAHNASAHDVQALRKLVSDYEIEPGNRYRDFDLNQQFHSLLIEMAGNGRLIDMYCEMLDVMHLYRFKLMHTPDWHERVVRLAREQTAVIDAIEEADASRAQAAMYVHMQSCLEYHLAVVRRIDEAPSKAG